MSALDRIKAEGFKSFSSLDLELRALNVLIGANGAGKSNFISIFRLLNQIVNSNLQVFVGRSGGADQLLHYGQKSTDLLAIHLYFGMNGYRCELVPASSDTLIFANEVVYFHDKAHYNVPYSIALGAGHRETELHDIVKGRKGRWRIAQYVLEAMQSWQVYHFHDTSSSAGIKHTGDIGDNSFLRPDASNLAAYLYLLRENEYSSYMNIVGVIRMVAPFFDDFMLRPSPFNANKIKLEWREKGSDTYFDANALSDGTLRFMSLATLLLQTKLPTTILLDEPELGLHPYAIALLADLLRSASERTQVIVSTQSVTLVNQFEPEDIIVVDRIKGQSTLERLTTQQVETWLGEYSLGDLWEKNILGGRPAPAI